MKTNTIGDVIAYLRKENNWTQKQLAEQLNVSDRTISKWERNVGMPDISFLPNLANLFQIDIESLLKGSLQINQFVGGNMKNTKFYVCTHCQNVITATSTVDVICCGRKLESLVPQKAEEHQQLIVSEVDGEWYISSHHPMTKEHYISFIAAMTGDQLQLIKQYPEWALQVRIPKKKYMKICWYDTKDGLLYQLLK